MKLAFWGSGPISHFHIPAARAAGFEPCIAYSRPGSDRLTAFGEKFSVATAASADSFLDQARDCDAVFVGLQTEVTPAALSQVLPLGIPVLVEKPGAMSSSALIETRNHAVDSELVGFAYNRRQYGSVNEAQKFVRANSHGVAHAVWPDSKEGRHQWIINGCHFVDVLTTIFGQLKLISSFRSENRTEFSVQLSSQSSFEINMILAPGSSSNPRISVFSGTKNAVLSPFESLTVFDGMTVLEPTVEIPIRRYLPREAIQVSEEISDFKPGFLNQWKLFAEMTKGKKRPTQLPGFDDAVPVLRLVEEIADAVGLD